MVAAILRFYDYFSIPFTHDDFSALFRLNYDTFRELIEKGVKPDGHPAGVQIFLYYWTRLFGIKEWIVKLPFTIFGLLAVVLIFRIGKIWYNETIGLITAAYLASIQYTVMYSQIARPYISGLFLSLAMFYFWSLLIKNTDNKFNKNLLLFVVFATLCAYNHYFSLLFATIVGFSGLFFINKKYLPKYIAAGVAIALLFSPHLNISLAQFRIGGLAWLGKPHNDFIIKYLYYLFNYSLYSIFVAVALVIYGILQKGNKKISLKKYLLFGTYFLLPLLIGFFYSLYYKPVLQFSVLIFSFPYLYFILFGHLAEQKVKTNLLIVLIILAVNIFSLIFQRHYYHLFYRSVYKEILVDYEKAKANKNTIFIIDSNKKIIKYYSEKLGIDTNFICFDNFKQEADLINFLNADTSAKYLYFGAISKNKPNSVAIILDYFPNVEWQKNYAGGTTYFFSKKYPPNDGRTFLAKQDFDKPATDTFFVFNNKKIVDSVFFSAPNSYLFNGNEWGLSYTRKIADLKKLKYDFIDISVKVKLIDTNVDAILVGTLQNSDTTVYWNGLNFKNFIPNNYKTNKWLTVYLSFKLSDIYLKYRHLQLKTYIWNRGKTRFLVDDFQIKLRPGNPVIYGLVNKID